MKVKKYVKRLLGGLLVVSIITTGISFRNVNAKESNFPTYKVGNLMILSDSYATFENYLPEGNTTWYPNLEKNDVAKVEDTWWHRLVKNTNATLIRNESYSGSAICNYGYGGGNSEFSFITRLDNLIDQGFFNENNIDTIIILGGTNDSWAGSPIGKEQFSNWSEEDKRSFIPAFCYLLDRIEKNVSNANVVCVINEGIKADITNGMVSVCEKYGVDCVKLSNIDKQEGHPSVAGMIAIENQIRSIFMEDTPIKYQKVDNTTFKEHIGKTAPTYNQKKDSDNTGYVFGGWYRIGENDTVGEVIKTAEGITGQVYAKFVPAYVLSVKAQNHQDVQTTGRLRLVSSVDDDSYKQVGFDVYFGNRDEEGYKATASGEKVYRKIRVNQSDNKVLEYSANEVFGEESTYFNIAVIDGIGQSSFKSTIYVKPFWETQDGTKVYGLGKYVCVQDGLDGIISIPINLNTAKKIAVGAVEITYPEELTYLTEDGYRAANRLLSEMKVRVDSSSHTIRCVGMAESVEKDLQANTDLYVSLRFKIADEYKDSVTVGKTRLNFTIKDTKFCNWDEELVDLSDDVWNIQY